MDISQYRGIVVGEGEDFLDPIIVERERDRLLKFYSLRLERGLTSPVIQSSNDVIKAATKIVKKAIEGYKRAPVRNTPEETFMCRIRVMSRYDKMSEIWEDIEPPRSKTHRYTNFDINRYVERDVADDTEKEAKPTIVYLTVRDEEENAFFEYRKKYYLTEFEFNESSDQMLLETIVADEVLLRRYINKKLDKKGIDEKLLDDIQKRYRDNLKVLGVSRSQRIADNTNQKGNVAQLATTLDEKLEEVKKLADANKREKIVKKLLVEHSLVSIKDIFNLIEELEFTRQRTLRPDMENIEPIATINQLPALEEIDAILNDASKKEVKR